MDATTTTVATVVVVSVGQWAKKDGTVSIKIVVGMMVLVLMLSVMGAANEKLAGQFAALMLTGAVFMYAIPITKKLGFSK
jgi:hypothetical protein